MITINEWTRYENNVVNEWFWTGLVFCLYMFVDTAALFGRSDIFI